MKLFYICLASIVLLSGCGKLKERIVVKEKTLPSWYMQPPASNAREIYGVGEGKDKQEALSNALASLLATLSVSISSKYSAKSVVRKGTVNRHDATYVNETQSEVQKIRISSYEVLQSAKLGFKKYAVLIKVDRMKFFQTLQKEIDQEFALIASWEKNRADKNALEQLSFYKKALQNLSDLQNRLLVMSVLNERFQSQKYLQKYEKLRNKRDKLLQSITFWVVSDYRPLSGPIEKGLSSKKLKIKNLHNAYHFTIYVDSNMQRASSYGFYIARAQINIATKDNSGNILATNSLNITGQSSQSYSIAKQDVAKKLSKQIDKEGIAKILNLDI
ncbi:MULTISPECIES: LPP20 family lipoprotein [Sulfurimonas]|uniref:LPP20 family lipoprotein n=1 Tax=Sulfurimonas TaxID=202746 RepID=UPI0012655DD1|nr:LPP20 family lipoprotein [Sulfurimonas indica]